jgi:zinc and cadmium transporter
VLLGYIIGFSLLGSVGSLIGAALILSFPRLFSRFRRRFLAFALGTLLGVTFLDILPHALESGGAETVMLTTLVAFLGFYLLEQFLHGHHAHTCATHADGPPLGRGAGHAVLVGDTLHNFVDGVLIAAAFMVSVPLGVLTALATFAHEIPQELGDLMILINSGFTPAQAYGFNFLSGLASLAGALLAYGFQAVLAPFIPYMLAIAAASFLYIAASNLDPVQHEDAHFGGRLAQSFSLLAGVGGLYMLHRLIA